MARYNMVVMGVFDEVRDAEYAIAALKSLGLKNEDISILAHPEAIPGSHHVQTIMEPSSGASVTTAGMVATLVGIGLCAIPLAGLLTAGPLVLAGGLASVTGANRPVDDLQEFGVPHEDAQVAIESVRRGGIAVIALVDRTMVRRASEAMARANAVDFRLRAEHWERDGWVFEPNAPAYTAVQIARERTRRAMGKRVYDEPPVIYDRITGPSMA
jgi:hypothetical protein